MDLTHPGNDGDQLLPAHHRLHLLQRLLLAALPQDAHLTVHIGIAHAQLHEEAIQLGVGQILCTGRADGVLSGQHHKGGRQIVGHAVYGDMALLHGLQQRRLGLAGGAVDLVGQQQIGHHRTGLIHHPPLLRQGKADDIRGHGVRCELHTLGFQPQRLGKGQRHGGLTHPRHVLQQHMALGQNGDPNLLHHIVLADDDLPHFPQNFLRYFVHIFLRLLQITMPAATTTTAAPAAIHTTAPERSCIRSSSAPAANT